MIFKIARQRKVFEAFMKRAIFSRSIIVLLILPAILVLTSRQMFCQVLTVRTTTITERIRIDGKLDEPAWLLATPISNMTQVIPKEGEAPSEKTEIRVLVDANALYFGITCYDRTPSRIVSSQLTRDTFLDPDDNVAIVLDTFLNQRGGYFFNVNPAGARTDGQISNNARFPSLDWDGIWDASARITEEGWIAEIIIPFKTLRFKPELKAWGFNVERTIKRNDETVRWAGPRMDSWLSNLAEAGSLEGFPEIHQGKGLDVRPYGVVRKDGDEYKLDGGLDVSKNLAPNLNASLTVNTDFAETEADTRQVNLTRFTLFYPEKRPFFLEGADVFETASGGGGGMFGGMGMGSDLMPFFSRTIGFYQNGGMSLEAPILVGGKITGKQSGFNIGVLDVLTDRVESVGLEKQNLFVGRVSHDFWRQSYVGGIITHGNPTGQGDNTLVGVDARLATSKFRGDKNLNLSLYLFRTDDKASNTSDYAGGFQLEYPNDRWTASLGWKQIGENFRPALGFVPRTGLRKASANLSFAERPEKWGIRRVSFGASPQVITNLKNRVDDWNIGLNVLNLELESGEMIMFNVRPTFERLPFAFEISRGIILPAGSYNYTTYGLSLMTSDRRRWMTNLNTSLGSYYNGTRKNVRVGLTYKPNNRVYLEADADRNDINLLQGKFYTQILSTQVNYNFSPNISWSNLVQYDTASRILGFQSRFRWILTPGSDVYLVMNRGWFNTFDHDLISTYDQGTVKLQYNFRF
jgi:hypothetical protein